MQQRARTIRLIWLAMGASVLLPCLLFAVAAWINYNHVQDLTTERLVRSLDIEQEEAQTAFSVVAHTLDDAADTLAGLSAQQIRDDRDRLHHELSKLTKQLPEAQAVSIYDAKGELLVSSRAEPPAQTNFGARDFIQAHLADHEGTYYGRVYPPPPGADPFFTASRGLYRDGSLDAVIEVSVPVHNFFQFYATMAYASGLQLALVRDDGTILARFPAAPSGARDKLEDNPGFREIIAQHANKGFYTAVSGIDDVSRRYAIRQIPGTPLYVQAGVSTASIRNEWLKAMAAHLIFGLPATLLLFVTWLAVLRRTESLYAEIDRRTTVEELLRQAQKMESIGQLTGGVAHDFNNLLTIILGNLEMAKRQLAEGSDPARAKLGTRIESAIQGATRAATLTKRLLAFSRQQTLSPTIVDVNRLLSGLADFLQRALGEDVSLEIVGGAGLWPIEADQTELEAAILNLAVNARDAMPEGGKLTIEASNTYLDEAYCGQNAEVRPGQYVQIAVSDTGAGMSPEVIERAFDPFFTTKEAGQGTGLGLSQVYGFVKQSGGHVKIYSEVGEGTTVKVYLRRHLRAAAPAAETEAEAGRGRRGETILVAEDDPEVRAYVLETLQGLGYSAVGAANAEDALLIFGKQRRIDLLLTDVVMPGANGRKLAEDAQRRQPDLKVLFMTGYSRNAIVHQGRLDPGVALIQKPLTGDLLATMVRKMLDG